MASRLAALARRRVVAPSLPWLITTRRVATRVAWQEHGRVSTARDDALPTTIETYLALRASPYELQALPDTSFIKLIYDSGSAGLTGLVQNIASDVLSLRIAPADSERLRRLLITLLNMLSYNARKLQIEPELVSRMVGALLEGPSGTVDDLPPFVAMYALRTLLTLRTTQGPHLAQIEPLFHRLVRTGDYPTIGEGLHVVEYLLEYSDLSSDALMDLVSRTVQCDGERIGEQTLQQARADGTRWLAWRQAQPDGTAAEACQGAWASHALRITILSLCCRTWLRLNRTHRFQHALRQLILALDAHSVPDDASGVLTASTPRTEMVRALLQTHIVHLAQSASRNGLAAAQASIEMFSADAVNMLPRVLALVCIKAIELDRPAIAEAVLGLVQSHAAPALARSAYARALLLQLGAVPLLRVLQHCWRTRRFADAQALYSWAHSALPGDKWDLFWPATVRAELVACVAACEMADEARSLFAQWIPQARIVPSGERNKWTHATPAVRHAGEAEHGGLVRPLVRLLRRDAVTPAFRSASAHAVRATPETMAPGMLLTAPCLLALVKLFGRTPRFGSPLDLPLAVRVRDYYLMAVPLESRSRPELTALAQASLIVGDRATAADVFRILYHRGFDASALAVLLRGAVDVHADEAVAAFLSLPDAADARDPVNNARLYAVLLSRCVTQSRFDLADRIQAAGEARNLGGRIAAEATPSQLASANLSPRATMRRVQALLDEGWTPEFRLINWAIKSIARGYTLREAGSADVRATNQALASAAKLYLLGASRLHTVDLAVTRFLLYHMGRAARHMPVHAKQTQPQWVLYMDRIAHALRWTRHLTGASQYAAMEHVEVPTGTRSASAPNVVPYPLLCQLTRAYDALGDARGVAETLAWIDEAGYDAASFPDTHAHRAFQRVAQRAQNQPPAPRTKPWWAAAWGALHS
ncbi:hypothetical protein CBS9595_002319 [Malassezia furfur]|nr:hypothetical protein CBS9595_002319 [Malassezia furfur]